jgi:hypothetical protein
MRIEKSILCFLLITFFVGISNPVSPSVWTPRDAPVRIEAAGIETEVGPASARTDEIEITKSRPNLNESDGYTDAIQHREDAKNSKKPAQNVEAQTKNRRNL